jgi:hypothetical protein
MEGRREGEGGVFISDHSALFFDCKSHRFCITSGNIISCLDSAWMDGCVGSGGKGHSVIAYFVFSFLLFSFVPTRCSGELYPELCEQRTDEVEDPLCSRDALFIYLF